jgi:hypothetical protein
MASKEVIAYTENYKRHEHHWHLPQWGKQFNGEPMHFPKRGEVYQCSCQAYFEFVKENYGSHPRITWQRISKWKVRRLIKARLQESEESNGE